MHIDLTILLNDNIISHYLIRKGRKRRYQEIEDDEKTAFFKISKNTKNQDFCFKAILLA